MPTNLYFYVILLGVIATALFDLWIIFLKRLGLPTLNFNYLGRWIGNFKQMKFTHENIGKAPPVAHEWMIGVAGHYVIGVIIATLLQLFFNAYWIIEPNIYAALMVGAFTVVFPLLIMQPAMGGGFAFNKTATPIKSCLKSLLNHVVFGFCLYLAGRLILVIG